MKTTEKRREIETDRDKQERKKERKSGKEKKNVYHRDRPGDFRGGEHGGTWQEMHTGEGMVIGYSIIENQS